MFYYPHQRGSGEEMRLVRKGTYKELIMPMWEEQELIQADEIIRSTLSPERICQRFAPEDIPQRYRYFGGSARLVFNSDIPPEKLFE